MADKKISELATASALTGTELIPVVQSSVTKKTTVNDVEAHVVTALGLGTIATQAASSVAITGGSIDGTVIGNTTKAAGNFTTLFANTSLGQGTQLIRSWDSGDTDIIGLTSGTSAAGGIWELASLVHGAVGIRGNGGTDSFWVFGADDWDTTPEYARVVAQFRADGGIVFPCPSGTTFDVGDGFFNVDPSTAVSVKTTFTLNSTTTATLNLVSDSDGNGAAASNIVFYDDAALKYVITKDSSNNFKITDSANGRSVLDYYAGSNGLYSDANLEVLSLATSNGVTSAANATIQGDLYVGRDGGSHSNIHFFDDTDNVWRTIAWRTDADTWQVEDSVGLMRNLAYSNATIGDLTLTGDLEVEGVVSLSIPPSCWTTNGLWHPYGGIYSSGSYGLTLSCNGYRNSSGTWTSLAVAGNSGASEITQHPSGYISMKVDTGKTTGTGYSLTQRLYIDTVDVYVLGNNYFRVSRYAGGGVRDAAYDNNGRLVINTSDATLKNVIGEIGYGLADVLSLSPVRFTWKDQDSWGSQEEIGLIAQEVREVIPEVVSEIKDGTLALSYQKLVPVLINAIKELSNRLDALEA